MKSVLLSLGVLLTAACAWAQSSLSGIVYPAPGEDVAGTVVIACYPAADGCDQRLSAFVQIAQGGASAAFRIDGLAPGQYLPLAWRDRNGDGILDEDEVAVHTVAGEPAYVQAPAEGIVLRFEQLAARAPAPAQLGGVPPELVGGWYAGSSSSVSYFDPAGGTFLTPSGEGTSYTFRPDSSYEKSTLVRSSLYSCRMEIFWYEAGRASFQDHLILLSPERHSAISQDNCLEQNNYQRTLPLEASYLGWNLARDEYGNLMLQLTSYVLDSYGRLALDPEAPVAVDFYRQE